MNYPHLHKEGKAIMMTNAAVCMAAASMFWVLGHNVTVNIIFTVIFAALAIFMLFFFRVPNREALIDDALVVSPGDGKVVSIAEVENTEFMDGPCRRVSIFLSVFNVHITWYPVSGNVKYYNYNPGKYLVAFHPKSSELNERTTIGIETESGATVGLRQIAGIIARRIVCYAGEGLSCDQAAEAGFIKFGSRLDIFLPLDAEVLVKKGDKVRGTLSPIARLK